MLLRRMRMTRLTLADLSKKMRDVDFFFFTDASSRTVSDIRRDAKVGLSLQGSAGILGQRPFMIAVEGKAELIESKARFAEHWTKDLDRWFDKRIDTPGLVLIKVHASRV